MFLLLVGFPANQSCSFYMRSFGSGLVLKQGEETSQKWLIKLIVQK